MLNFKNITFFFILLFLVIGIADFFLLKIDPEAYFLLFLCWFLFTVIGSFSMRWNFHLKAITKLKVQGKTIALTFDDGPHPEYTFQVLELLNKYKATATFFLIGSRVQEHPEIVRRIAEDGHTIGNHSYTHGFWIDFKNTASWIEEIESTDSAIRNITGKNPSLFRPPYGVTTPAMSKALQHTGHQVAGWSIRPFDTVLKNPKRVVNFIEKRISPGRIILLHDSQKEVIEILEHLLLILRDNGYETVSLNDFNEK
jgi:peptidoglycan/xylan/chitin deacetylase (PgdA/CDA1 family)